MKKTVNLEIIIVNYNSEFWLRKTLSSLQQFYLTQTKRDVLVTVVDNASTDTSIDVVKKQFPWVNLIVLDSNHGFAYGNNVALKESKATYVMLLNSDVELTEKSNLDLLIEQLEINPKIGVITPRVEFTTGEIDPACHRGEPTLWASFTYFSKLENIFPQSKLFGQYHQTYKNLYERHTIDACSGAAMIVRSSALEEVGLLDEQFFMYAEDLDWCKRFRQKRYTIVYEPAVTVIHHKYKSGIKSSSQKLSKNTRKHFYSTMLQYYDKHYGKRYPRFIRTIIKYITIIKKGV